MATKKANFKLSNIADFIGKYWAVLLGVIGFFIVLYPMLKRILKNQQTSTMANDVSNQAQQTVLENINPQTQISKADQITTRKDVQDAAHKIANALGTTPATGVFSSLWSWLNPYSWTEDDKFAIDLVIYQRNNFHLLELLYYSCYTANRNLKNDLLTYVDQNELKRLEPYNLF